LRSGRPGRTLQALKGITFAFVAFLFSCQGTGFNRVGSMLRATRSLRPHRPSCAAFPSLFLASGSCATHCNRLLFQPLTAFSFRRCGSLSRAGQLLTAPPFGLFQLPRFAAEVAFSPACRERGQVITVSRGEHSHAVEGRNWKIKELGRVGLRAFRGADRG